MHFIIPFFSFILFFNSLSFADCFLFQKDNNIVIQEGDCNTRYSPGCSFNIAVALMSFEEGILNNSTDPTIDYNNTYQEYTTSFCKQSKNPVTWMRDSCIWYTGLNVSKLGYNKFDSYVKKFNYGNKDVSGNKGQNNSLYNSWVSSSLLISPSEQLSFLNKILYKQLDLQDSSYEKTKEILYIQDVYAGYKLYGKTGTASVLDKLGNKTNYKQGWFVGWIEKDGKFYTIVNHIVDKNKEKIPPSLRIRGDTIIRLFYIIENLERK